jgi:hypothetical protein
MAVACHKVGNRAGLKNRKERTMSTSKAKKKGPPPVFRARVGRCTASVFEQKNQEDNRTFFTINVQRGVRNEEDGSWKNYNSFGGREVQNAIKALDLAHNWVIAAEAKIYGSHPADDPEPAADDMEGFEPSYEPN